MNWRGAGLAVLCAGLAAGCGTQTTTAASPAPQVTTAPLSTSLATSLAIAQGTWAVAVMGGSAAAENNFWQLFVRPTGASSWSEVTPPGVADNGGLVAAAGPAGTPLLVGFRPSQGLTFSPLAASTDQGRKWTTGLLGAGLADVPDALAAGPSGRALALLRDGTIETAATAGAVAAGPAAGNRDARARDRRFLGRAGGSQVQAHRLAAGRGGYRLGEGPGDQRADSVRLLELGPP